MVVRLLLICLAAYVAVRLAARVIRYLAAAPRREAVVGPENSTATSEMIQDPVCGMYVPGHETITAVSNGQVVHFCSEECRDKFVNDRVRRP